MKFKKQQNNRIHSKTEKVNMDTIDLHDGKDMWFNEISDDVANYKQASEEMAVSLKVEAKKCLDSEIANYNMKNSKSNSDYRWMKTATTKGTVSDRIAACTVLIESNPITNLEMLKNLVSMAKVGKKKECLIVIDTLTELFLTSLLKPNKKLKPFHTRPLTMLSEISSGNARTRQKYLMHWYFEDQLKDVYTNFVLALNRAAHDTLDTNKEKAIGAMYKLLAGNPEQEQQLLTFLVNKLGDPSQKVASKAIYCLNQLLFRHINMQNVVLTEVEKLIFRTNVAPKAQYYGICFLSQFYLSHESTDVAKKLVEVYFAFFKASVKKGDVDSRMMSALLMGVNRAYPYAKLEQQKFNDHIDTMYRIVHIANFNVGLHALMLLYQVSDYTENINNRFYSALYKKLHDPKLITTTHQAIFLNLIYKALMKDNEASRIKAFIKRLLQLTLLLQPPFTCGILYLISQLMTKKPNLQALKLEEIDKLPLNKFEENDEDEKYNDVIDNNAIIKIEDDDEDLNQSQNPENDNKEDIDIKPDIDVKEGPSWYHCSTTIKQEKKDPKSYDPFNRNPLFAGADYTAYLELLHLKQHYHPTVSLYAKNLLEGTPISYSGDPLKDFSLIQFLERFVFKNPKKYNSNDGSHPTFGIRKKYKPTGLRSLALNSEKYLQEHEKNIPVDELFLYKYMQTKAKKKDTNDDKSDVDSVASEEFEEMLDKMSGHKELDDEIDFMNEIGENLKNKSNKKLKDDQEDTDESEVESDMDSLNDDENEDMSDNESDKEDIGPEDEDKDLFQDIDDDNMSDIVFESQEGEENVKMKKKLKKKGNVNSIFASAEEFASILDDEGSKSKGSGTLNALFNKDNAAQKQIAWEEKRNNWLQGYNKAIGKRGKNIDSHEKKHNKKRPNKSKNYNKNKKRKMS